MKTLGLFVGTTWLSTVDYYRIINQEINKRLGSLTIIHATAAVDFILN